MSDDVARLDSALLNLRRFLEAPGAADRCRAGSMAHGGQQVEVSTLLVVDAIARRGVATECTIGHAAEALQVAHSTASRLVERAVRAGMVLSHRSTDDPRRAALRLTEEGIELRQHALRFRLERLEGLMADWSAADVATFTRLLERFAEAAHPPSMKEES